MGPQAAARTVANRLRLDPSRARSAGARALGKTDNTPQPTTTGQADGKQAEAKSAEGAQGEVSRGETLSGREKPLPALPME